jgi:hypothetical protein
MTDKKMELPEDLKTTLKHEWLNYCKSNPLVIKDFKELVQAGWGIKTPDGGFRPSSPIILGILIGLHPKLSSFIATCLKLNNDSDKIIAVLNLNFDPEKELEKLAKEKEVEKQEIGIKQEQASILLSNDPEYKAANEGLNQIREQIKQENSS